MTTRRLGVASALVDGAWCDGDVEVDGDGRIAAVGSQPAGRGNVAVPGFVDVQVNGFAGVDFSHCDVDGHRAAASALARSGVTSYLVTIPTAAPDRYDEVLGAAAGWIGTRSTGARPLGVHLEGPFLTRPGAHRPEWLRPPSTGLCDAYLALAPVLMMTLAPEPDRAIDLVRHLARRGVITSVGHTDADATTTHRAFDAGARFVTHLWNAQTGPASRAPGVVGAALARPGIFVGIIADLVHVARDTLSFSLAALGERAVVVSDAVAAAGLDDASLGPGGGARLPDGTLAGGTAPLDVHLRNLVACGLSVERAVGCLTTAPSKLLGRDDVGCLRPGAPADVAVLDDDLHVVQTLVGGATDPG